ncbi:uncharacterized protein IUM83_18080 [Phytophthora cinnamomi]|uniref:uncharacterized protein n=1 Tax=Phytophthora cinnamomi TaxID=4785 RepID=UPI003559BEA0|nr:hypothetical protein IUM83_18080 [Phytophthora cinnamomi]
MFLQRYAHVVLDAVLGSYVKNIDPAALQISVWNGQIEVEAVELQPDAFPLPGHVRLAKGTLRRLRIDLPWTNLAGQPIRVDIQDVSLLLRVGAADAHAQEQATPDERRHKRQTLQRKRAAVDAVEKATAFSERTQQTQPPHRSWTQSFLFKLLAKLLDNVQLHVQHLHLRLEDAVSEPGRPYALGMTLEAIIAKSADEGWNYTMVGRAQDGGAFIRKKMDVNKLGVYWSLPLVPVPPDALKDAEAFATLMRSSFAAGKASEPAPLTPLFKQSDYIVHPLTVSMKLTVNDGDAKLPITHQELSERVLSRLGTPWLVETIDAIGDEAWSEFLDMMPKLAGERKYTLGFVFSEAWSVARDLTEEEDEIPSVQQFKEALSSCMQWSLEEVDRVEHCIVKYREAVVHVMEEKSTYIDAQASIDQISTSLHRQQYMSALSLISFLTVKRRQARYLVLRPKRVRVEDNPRAWWRYAVNAVLLDVRERLAHVDWEALEQKRQQRNRYKDLYLVLEHGTTFAATLVPPELRLLPKEMARTELDDLEFGMEVQELIRLRRAVRKCIADKEKEKEVLSKLQRQRESELKGEGGGSQGSEVPASSRLWSYATWLTGAGTTQGGSSGQDTTSRRGGDMRVEDVKWSDQDTKDLYEAIDFHPVEDDNESKVSDSGEIEDAAVRKKRMAQEHQHILYRFQLTLCKASFGLSLEDVPADLSGLTLREGANNAALLKSTSSSYLTASLDDVEIQFLVNVTFTSTADRSLLLSLLSPDMSSVLSTLISAAAALVSNLDQAPIRVPEFYVENLLETTHTLAFYAMQHYLHHGLRSWYSIMGSVDFLGNPIGLVSTLGTGVKDFFYTPAQMLLEDENGLRIDNLRTGMTKGSKSLLRNTAVGIFHTTGKITETLGKGIALLAMDEQYNVQRQRASTRQIKKINDLGDAIAEGSKGLVGGVWDGIKGVVAAPVRGAEQDGAGGFVVGIGKGVAGLIVKPTAGFLDLLTSLSRGAKTSAESLDGTDRNAFDTVTRFRLPRRICSDGVLVSYSEREARGYAVLLLTSLDATDDYVYHVDYGIEPHRGLLLLTDKRLICLSGKTGQKLWEVALDSTLEVIVEGATLKIGQSTSPSRSYNIECDNEVAATNFRVAVDSARVDVSATRYLLLNLEKSQEESRIISSGRFGSGATGLMNNDEDRTDLHVLMENVQDTTVTGLSNDDLRSQPLRSVRVEVCHLQNKDAHANVPNRAIDKLLSFSVFQIQVYGGPYQWTVFRRFSEFRELCTKLEAAGYLLDGLPPLPPRTFLPSTRAPVAKHRQEVLNMFLQAAIMHSVISRSAAMLDFLTREAGEEQGTKIFKWM